MLKTKTRAIVSVAGLLLIVSAFLLNFPQEDSSAAECSTPPCNTTFQVNVRESLTVKVTAPKSTSDWAHGGIDEFLRNTIGLEVSTNSSGGFVASMYSKNSTQLTNAISSSVKIDTLSGSSTRSGFPSDKWGYSLKNGSYNSKTYGETDAGNGSSNYYPLTTNNNITVLKGSSSGTQSIYFGAKASVSKAYGAYLGTVVINVVAGTQADPGGTLPDNPVNPTDDAIGGGASYDNNNERTIYTTSSSTSTTTATTTQIVSGDARDIYSSPAGETNRTESNIADGSGVATGLAIAASTAAVGGMVFFILAKRREDEEEDEEELQ